MARLSPRKVLASQLRWFVGVRGLLSRKDRDAVIVQCYEGMEPRFETAETALTQLTDEDLPPEVMAGFFNDMDQIMDIHDELTQVACTIKRRQSGTPAVSTGHVGCPHLN